ncbi:uncharacterized protein LOC119723500 [Patiria miniata]|uniref:AAA+ ATPase domain-containing protein n=1 Tax=Patiria miniata TaxID=46514 RepID=A0A913ZGH0_PATMI|nr:uncharacterized protein LOC119723500 [Patiria miniata]
MTGHVIWLIQSRKMPSYSACKLLSPHAPYGQLCLRSKPVADIISAIVETVSEDRYEVFKVLDDFKFWELIFQAKGEAASEIQHGDNFQAVVQLLNTVQQSFVEMSVSVTFVQKLVQANGLDMLPKLCQMATSDGGGESTMCDQSFKDALEVINRHICVLKKCEQFLAFYERFAMNICQDDLEATRKEIHLRWQDINSDSDVQLKNLIAEDYWGVLEPVCQISEAVSTIAPSKVFFNMCLYMVEGESCDTEEREPLQVNPFTELVSTNCLPKFRSLSLDIAQGCEVVIGDIKGPFEGVSEKELSGELDIMSRFIDKTIDGQSKVFLKSWVKLERIRQYAKQLQCLFRTFEVPSKASCTLIGDVEKLLSIFEPTNAETPLQQVHLAVTRIEDVDRKFTDEDWRAIHELINSEQLIQFLRPIIDDDLRNLTDAVEERSDSFVNESTVSDLIEVQRYMGSFLRVEVLDTPEKLIEAIAESRELGIKKVSDKIKTCNDHFHALKNLYNNIAQRGEMTKKIIRNAIHGGSYTFLLKEGEEVCNVSMSYEREDNSSATFEKDELNDLRSRALLMVNSRMSYQPHSQGEGKEESMSKLLEEFIYCVDEVIEIVDLCSGLANSGQYLFKSFQERVTGWEDLLLLKQDLKTKFDCWTEILELARGEYYFLNFYHSKQLWMLDQFFRGEIDDNVEIVNLFHYVSPGISVGSQLIQHYEEPEDLADVKARVFQTGRALDKIFSNSSSEPRDINCLKSSQKASVDNTVQPGNVYVAELDTNSTNSVPVLMTLLKNTTGKYPQANQVLFCHPETAWDEVYLLLQRCRKASKRNSSALYALINVEQLTTEFQFMLVDEVKELQQNDRAFLLAIICCGGCHHHIIDQFSPHYTHQIQGMTTNEMRDCLEQGCPNVEVITSEVPGLGKSEYIACKAAEKRENAILFEIGGPLTKTDLVRQLLQKSPSEYQALHIDIRSTSDVNLVDSFIFELLVVGMAVAGTHLCELRYSKVFIEIANAHEHHLRDSLINCCNFKRHHIEWDNYSSFLVSQEANSPVQVVCHYLKAVKDGAVDSKEIHFTGPLKDKLLSDDHCRQLLRDNFSPTSKMAFTTVNMFLNVLATELKKMSASHYFTIEALRDMLGTGPHCVRSDLFKALEAVAREFSSRSVESSGKQPLTGRDAAEALSELQEGASVTAEKMVERVKGMVQWADSNHLMVVFNQQDTQTCSTLYRLLSQVPDSVKNLFENQLDSKLPDYQLMSQAELQTVLERISRTTRDEFDRSKLGHLNTMYALTPDNMMKMVLIHMRVKSRVPVVIMGETGCGKTTLITYLARICEVPFHVQNFHAGVSKDTIIDFIAKIRNIAEANLNQQIWCFLDEINTCDHLGLLSEIICHHTCLGEQLPYNLVFLAACNPYSLRKGKLSTSGLTEKLVLDEQSKLVYRVHPLPEALMDYVWDYGALNAKDEEAYTRRMVNDIREDLIPLFVDLLIMSQNFIKSNMENKYCVSLRDISRCKYLAKWMTEMLNEKGLAKLHLPGHVFDNDSNIRAVVLALAHCYHSRLSSAEDRKRYREEVAQRFQKKHHNVTEGLIEEVIKTEQLDILNRMELEEGIAKNEALRENVFVVLISILNRIPVFLVGKPGCSKSLSMQLIRSNLRGPDSKDKYFKTLPAVYVVSYQGSESSTSEGIIKVFEKARRYKEANPDIIPVVLLDEIGLAETSSFNPLKVLHSLLEPSTGDFPEMAVVGISNWALDAAKMNRAVHLSRPEPNEADLFETAKSIRDESTQRRASETDAHKPRDDQQLKKLAKAYYDYQHKQTHANFHGLRDYYSLIKSMAMPPSTQEGLSSLESGLRRNFGGIRSDMPDIMNTFMEALDVAQNPERHPSALDLIKENLEDKHARHLMLITSGDSALSIIEKVLFELNKKPIILLGSRFDDDVSEEYNYRILSRIILCMEEGYVLVLRDLENVYSSLYDMLNQNYTVVGKKRHCRVALGAYSNPMCQVHPDFRCIVIVDQQKVDYSDPPLLNRFEKQTLTFMDIVSDEQKRAIDTLRRWVEDISTVEEMQFTPSEAFLGYHTDTLPSLVAFRCQEMSSQTMDFREIADTCKQDLLKIASTDAVLRATKSHLAIEEQEEVLCIQKKYLDLPLNGGLKHFLQHAIFEQAPSASLVDGEFQIRPCKLIVYTYCTIHVDLDQCIDGLLTMQAAKLSQFKSERQLTEALQRFVESDDQLFILQCKTSLNAQHMLLAKCQIDKCLEEYTKAGSPQGLKHACFIVHVERDQNIGGMTTTFPWQFNFLCGWQQVTVDSLEQPKLQVDEVIKMSISDICAKSVDIDSVIKDKLLWCFSCISYDHRSKTVDEILQLIRGVTECPELLQCLSMKILDDIKEEVVDGFSIDKMSWQVAVACEVELLFECASFILALIEHVKRRISQPLFKIVFFLEAHNAWNSYLNREECQIVWETMLMNPAVCDVRSTSLPDPKGIESCKIDTPPPALCFPFFHKLYTIIEEHMKFLRADAVAKLVAEQSFVQSEEMVVQLTSILNGGLPEAITYDMAQVIDNEFLLQHIQSYLNDLCNVFSSMYVSQMSLDMRINTTKLLVQHQTLGLGEVCSANEELSKWHIALLMNSELFAAQLQLLNIYHLATGNDSVQLLLSVLGTNCKKSAVSILSLENGLDPHEDEQSETSEEFVAASDELLDDLDSDNESFESALESYYGETDDMASFGGETEESSLKFQLVLSVCQSLLPSTGILEKFSGQESWVRFVNNILLSAASIEVRPRELHYLHFCKDFVNLIALPSHLPDHFLARLGELIVTTEEVNVLDSENILSFVEETIKFIQQESSSQSDTKEHHLFLSKYFGRCIEANVETPLLKDICRSLVTDDGSLIEGSRLVMWRIIRSEIDDTDQDTVFTELISDDVNRDKHSDNLVILDDMLQNQQDGLNSHFATVCCDLIGECGFCNLTSRGLMEGHSGYKTTSIFASRVLATSTACSLKFVCALAFLSKLFRVFAEIFTDNSRSGNFLRSETACSLIQELKGLADFLGSSETPVDVHKWILKCMFHQDISLFNLSQAVSVLSKSGVIFQKIHYQSLLRPVIGYSPMNYMEKYSDVRDALAQLHRQDDKAGMKAVISKLETSPKHRLALMAVLVDFSYLVSTTRNLSDSEKCQAQWIIKEIEGTNLHKTAWYCLMRGISGVSDFKGILQLSKKSEVQDAQLASVLMHLATVILGSLQPGKEQGIFHQLFSSQAVAKKGTFFPGSQKQSSTEAARTRTVVCHCGLQFVQDLRYERYQNCPTCGNLIFGNTTPDGNVRQHTQRPSGYSYPPVLQLWNTLQGNKDMSIASQLVTDFMVHGCLYLAAEVFPDDFKKVSFCEGNMLEARLLELWSVLPLVLRANSQDTAVLLHCIITESSDVLVSPQYTGASASVINHQEMEIHNVVEKVLQNSTLAKRQFFEDSFNMFGTPAESINHHMHELDNIDESTSKILPRSSRKKREPSLEDLRACFCNHSSNNSERFPFLHLVLSRNNALKYVAFLPALLRWNLLVSSHMNLQRATHKYGNKPIRVLLDAQPNMSEPWSDFKEAFNEVCATWTELTGETTRPDDITLDSQIKECLIPKVTEENTLKRMIRTLQETQNSFLMQALSIAATTDCPAISFLVKDSHLVAAPTKPLNLVRRKDVILPPSDGCLCYHDINTEYGHGTEIYYDLNQIEMEVALSTVLNKVIITDGSTFEGFIFADDLYSSSTGILDEVASKVGQEPLPKDIVNRVIQGDRKRYGTFTNDLLQTVEVLMGLLKRTSGDPEATLEDFISKWSSVFSIQSADLLGSIKLKHIVALYHRLEVLLSAAVIQTLGKEYRTKLPTKSEHELDKCCSDYPPDVVTQFRDILKRFVFRYLRARRDFHPNRSERLRDLLGGMAGYDRVIPLIHKDTQLCHIVNLLEYLDKTIQRKEEKAVKGKRRGAKKAAPSAGLY